MQTVGAGTAALVLLAGLAPAWTSRQAQDAEQKLKAIQQRLEQEEKDWRQVFQAAHTDQEREALVAEFPGPEFLPEFRALAREVPGSEVAAEAWITVYEIAGRAKDPSSAKEALERLVTDHLASDKLAMFVARLGYSSPSPEILDALHTVAAQAPKREVQASATSSIAMLLAQDPARAAEARATFVKLRDTFGDLKSLNGSPYKEAAVAGLFELDHLQVGMPVPDFEGRDQADQSFRLADYKGKVVLVDFWGFW
jgi:hypothetical protein